MTYVSKTPGSHALGRLARAQYLFANGTLWMSDELLKSEQVAKAHVDMRAYGLMPQPLNGQWIMVNPYVAVKFVRPRSVKAVMTHIYTQCWTKLGNYYARMHMVNGRLPGKVTRAKRLAEIADWLKSNAPKMLRRINYSNGRVSSYFCYVHNETYMSNMDPNVEPLHAIVLTSSYGSHTPAEWNKRLQTLGIV